MDFLNGNKLKGYLSNESRRLNIHSNYAYTYYFSRYFLERIVKDPNINFVVKGSISQLSGTKTLFRPITDIDVVSDLDLVDSSYLLEKFISNFDDRVKFKVKEKFITTNETSNFKILCNFDNIQHLIRLDLKKETIGNKVTQSLPEVMKLDKEYSISTIPIESHIANKIYVILKNADRTKKLNKDTRRFKDFYDLYVMITYIDYNKELVDYFFNDLMQTEEIKLENIDPVVFNSNFVKNYIDFYNQDRQKYGFLVDVPFDQTIDVVNEEISKKVRV